MLPLVKMSLSFLRTNSGVFPEVYNISQFPCQISSFPPLRKKDNVDYKTGISFTVITKINALWEKKVI